MKRGFTIIELVVAAAIIVVITAVALPRYNYFSDQQDFVSSSNELARCISAAQGEALRVGNSSASKRFVDAHITIAGDGSINCKVRANRSSTINSALMEDLMVEDSVYSPKIMRYTKFDGAGDSLQVVGKASTLNASTLRSIKIVFGSVERGIPVGIATNDGVSTTVFYSSTSTSTTQGFETKLKLRSPDNSDFYGQIYIGAFGSPIAFKDQSK